MLPSKLQPGDTIGLVVPSKPFLTEKKFELDGFLGYMKEQGMNVKISPNFYKIDKYKTSAGTPQQRADDINAMFADPTIKAIWCLQGGDTAIQLVDLLDYSLVKQNPKIFLGKSDIDILLLAINSQTDLITFHSCDAKIGSNKELDFTYTKKWFKERLFSGSKVIEPSAERFCIRGGEAQGRIIGCNLTSLVKLLGTDYQPDFAGVILFLETFRSNAKEVIWKLARLRLAGVFDEISGIVVGNNFEFSDDNFTVEELVRDFTGEYNLPILKINEFGHYQPHAFLPIGAEAKMDATQKKLEVVSDFVKLI